MAHVCAQNLTQALDNIKKAREKADLTLQHLDTAQQVLCSSAVYNMPYCHSTNIKHHLVLLSALSQNNGVPIG